MKNLANCTPTEFFTQAVKIKKAAQKWLTDTNIVNIRKDYPKMQVIPKDAPPEEVRRITSEYREELNKKATENTLQIFDAVFEEHPEETLELLALICFVDPDKVDEHPVKDYLKSFAEMITDEDVIGFFISLQRLGALSGAR